MFSNSYNKQFTKHNNLSSAIKIFVLIICLFVIQFAFYFTNEYQYLHINKNNSNLNCSNCTESAIIEDNSKNNFLFTCKNKANITLNKNIFSFNENINLDFDVDRELKNNVSTLSGSAIIDEIEENIDKQLEDIDTSKMDEIIFSMNNLEKETLTSSSFITIVKKFINGEGSEYFGNFFDYTASILFANILNYLPYFAIIIIICISFSLLGQFSSGKSGMSGAMYIILFCTISIIVLKLVLSLLHLAQSSINSMQSQVEVIFPILLTLITALGSAVTASTFQPMLAIFSTSISKIFSYLLIPIFIFSIIFSVIGNMSKNVKLDKFAKFFSSLFSYIIGITFTIFLAFLSIHGLTVSSIDSISLKTAKFAIKSYVPMVGSYLSDGISVILASSVLIKNAIGVSGLVIMLLTILSPIINVMVVILLLRLSSAILEPICDKEISDFLYSVSKSLVLIVVAVVAVGLMYIISTSILLSCSNIL